MSGDWASWSANDVAERLQAKGFSETAEAFLDNDIEGEYIPDVTEEILKDLGITIGQRLLVLKYFSEITGKQTAPLKSPRLLNPQITERSSAMRSSNASMQSTRQSGSMQQTQSTSGGVGPALNRAAQLRQAATPSAGYDADKAENVRQKHQEQHDKMVRQMQAGRRYAKYERDVEAGIATGPPPDLPPIEEPEGLVECPNCHRRMSESASKFHFPSCAATNGRRTAPRGRR